MKRLTDQHFDRRIAALKARLKQTSIRHANLLDHLRLDHLRPDYPRRWTR